MEQSVLYAPICGIKKTGNADLYWCTCVYIVETAVVAFNANISQQVSVGQTTYKMQCANSYTEEVLYRTGMY